MNYQRFMRSFALNFNLSTVSNGRANVALFRLQSCGCRGCRDKTPDAAGRTSYICSDQDGLRVLEYSAADRWEARPGDVVFRRGERWYVLRYGPELAAFGEGIKFRPAGAQRSFALPY